MKFDVRTAKEYANQGRLEEWIHAYLTGGPWHNKDLSTGLKKERRWWRGPLELPVARLTRCVGIEAGREYEVSREYWEGRMAKMIASIQSTKASPLDMPPLIAEFRGSLNDPAQLSVRDGNHRLGAYERLGWPTAWVVIWFNAAEEYERGGSY